MTVIGYKAEFKTFDGTWLTYSENGKLEEYQSPYYFEELERALEIIDIEMKQFDSLIEYRITEVDDEN